MSGYGLQWQGSGQETEMVSSALAIVVPGLENFKLEYRGGLGHKLKHAACI